MFNFSKYYRDYRIFGIILVGIYVTLLVGGLSIGLRSLIFPTEITSSSGTPSGSIFGLVTLIYLAFAMIALKMLGTKSQAPLFNTAIKVFLAGAGLQIITSIAFFVWASTNTVTPSFTQYTVVTAPGALIQYIGWIVLAKAFFSIPTPPTQIAAPSTGYFPPSPSAGQTKYCIHCGAANSPDMIYCGKCGKKQ